MSLRMSGSEVGMALAAVLFAIGLCGMIARRSLVFMLLCAEIMLNAAGFAFIVAGSHWGKPEGQIMFIFLLVTAAAEVAVGLALILALSRPARPESPGSPSASLDSDDFARGGD